MASPAEVVQSTFSLAQNYAAAATVQLNSFVNALNSSIYTPPTVSVTWETLAAPTIPSAPAKPTLPAINFVAPGSTPTAMNETIPELTIPDFTDIPPELSLPAAPTVSYGVVPSVPSIGEVTVPDAPTITTPALPTYLTINTVAFGGVDLREEWLSALETAPTLELAEPTPYSYALGAEYASTLLDALKTKLADRMNGGTGLPAAVEQAIWDRARSREAAAAQSNIDEIARTGEALGFRLPPGVVVAQTRQAQQDYYDKLSSLSRDVAIKQAELEQSNLKDTIAAGMQLEGQLIDYSLKLEQLSFENARAYAENAIQLHNATVEKYRALLEGYQAYASVYKTIIDGQLAKVEVYKAQLQAEQTKAEINNTLVQQYKAQIDASMAQVEIFRAQVSAAQTLVELEQAKIGAASEQIRAYVATVNAETSKVEAYKASVQAEATKTEVYKIRADVYASRVNAVAERSRALVSRYSALASAKAAEWEGYRSQVQAESTRIDALAKQSGALLDSFRAELAANQATAQMQTTVWESNMKQYEAGVNVAMQAARINNDATIQTNNARLDAAKAGTQVFAQLTASAYSMMHTSAGVSGSSSTGVGYSYSGAVTGSVAPITAI